MEKNLFESLYSYRPRKKVTPGENFLTEAFAYILSSNSDICKSWVAEVTKGEIKKGDILEDPDVDTQISYLKPKSKSIYLSIDMVITLSVKNMGDCVLFFEHKWNGPINRDQLKTYREILSFMDKRSWLYSITATVMQRAEAEDLCDNSILWESVCNFLSERETQSTMVIEFIEFLKNKGLGPQEPLSLGKIAAYTFSLSVPNDCLRLTNILAEKQWNFLPARFRDNKTVSKLRWGRVGLDFGATVPSDWNPNLFAGFLLYGRDHGVELCDYRRGIDLMFAIEAQPKVALKGKAFKDKTRAIIEEFPTLTVQTSDQLKNRWRKLFIREPLAEIIKIYEDENKQIAAIYKRFKEYCTILFSDGSLDKLFQKTWSEKK
jgi:hypothetical protein